MDAIDMTLANTLQFGDTDIFPVPYEYNYLRKKIGRVKECIKAAGSSICDDTNNSLHLEVRKPRGGNRIATLIDPLLHLEYLALAIEIAGITEKSRLRKEDNIVHSYRFSPDETTGKLFDSNYGFASFKSACREKEKTEYTYRIKVDVSDFYRSINLDTLETILKRHDINSVTIDRLKTILSGINRNGNCGLPVGGNASRILAEILLNEFDQYCVNEGVDFVRFVDDIVVFSKKNEIKDLFTVHQKLSSMGLSINYRKLEILPKHSEAYEEFCLYDESRENPDKIILDNEIKRIKENKGIYPGILERITNPYEVNIFLWMLADVSGYVHTGFNSMCKWMLKHRNILDDVVVDKVHKAFVSLLKSSYTGEKQSYAIRVAGLKKTEEAARILIKCYTGSIDSLIKSNAIHVFGSWGHADWLWNNYGGGFSLMDGWERRAYIMIPGTEQIWKNEKLSPLEQMLAW